MYHISPNMQAMSEAIFWETTDFRYRWNNYKSSSRKFDIKVSIMLEHLYRHISSPGHMGILHHVSVTFIDKTDGSGPKKREEEY